MPSRKNSNRFSRADEPRSKAPSTSTESRASGKGEMKVSSKQLAVSSEKIESRRRKAEGGKKFLVFALYCSLLTAYCLLLFSCKREERGYRVEAPAASRINSKRLSELQPGTPQPSIEPV